MIIFSTLVFSLFLCGMRSGAWQDKKDQVELKYEVSVVLKLIQVYVTDMEGNPVTDLTKEDFILRDNGEIKTITDFETHFLSLPKPGQTPAEVTELPSQTEAPPPAVLSRKFFFLIDYGRNGLYGINKSKATALHFVDTKVQTGDEIAVLSLSALRGLILHEYLTTDHDLVRTTIRNMKGVPGGFAGGEGADVGQGYIESGVVLESSGAGAEEMRHGNVNALDTIEILREFARSLRYIPGYKNIVFFSTGFSGGGNTEFRYLFEDLCNELASSSAPVYAVWTQATWGKTIWGADYLKRLSDQSGGKFFSDVADAEAVAQGIQQITGNYYVLGFVIDEKWDGRFQRIKVEVKRKGCLVYAQGGYFNPKPFTEYSDFEKQLHLYDLATSDNPQFQVPVVFPAVALPCAVSEGSNLVMLSGISMDKIREFARGETEVVNLIFDEEKNLAFYQEGRVNFYSLSADNICVYSIASLEPGRYECRLVLRDPKTGKGAVASSPLVFPEPAAPGINLFPPLLLIPERETSYIKLTPEDKKRKDEESLSIESYFPFLSNQYSPVIGEVDRGVQKLLAVLRLSILGVPEHEIDLLVNLVDQTSQKTEELSNSSILSAETIRGSEVLLIEIPLPELGPGSYSLEFIADELSTQTQSRAVRSFEIK